MATQAYDGDTPEPNGEKPHSLWRSDDGWALKCPFCGREKLSDDRLGVHLVRKHWYEIDQTTEGKRE